MFMIYSYEVFTARLILQHWTITSTFSEGQLKPRHMTTGISCVQKSWREGQKTRHVFQGSFRSHLPIHKTLHPQLQWEQHHPPKNWSGKIYPAFKARRIRWLKNNCLVNFLILWNQRFKIQWQQNVWSYDSKAYTGYKHWGSLRFQMSFCVVFLDRKQENVVSLLWGVNYNPNQNFLGPFKTFLTIMYSTNIKQV